MTRIGFAYNQKPDRPDSPAPCAPRAFAGAPRASGISAALAVPRAAPDSDLYAEWDAPSTVNAVAAALSQFGEVIRLEATDDFPQRLREARPDIVFNIAEGLRGPNREAHVPAICEFYGIPYSGSDPFTLSLCLDKSRTKEALRAHGIPTARWTVVRSAQDLDAALALAPYPLFAKPLHEGSSKGISEQSLVTSATQLRVVVMSLLGDYDQPVLVETYLPGAEFTCGVIGNGSGARVLPLVGLDFSALPGGALPIYGYEAKWLWDTADHPLDIFTCPAPVSDALRAEIERAVLRTYDALGCRDWARIDVRLGATGRANVVEVNPLPGILPDPADNSCLPKAARAAGLDYDALIGACLRAAARRQGVLLRGTAR